MCFCKRIFLFLTLILNTGSAFAVAQLSISSIFVHPITDLSNEESLVQIEVGFEKISSENDVHKIASNLYSAGLESILPGALLNENLLIGLSNARFGEQTLNYIVHDLFYKGHDTSKIGNEPVKIISTLRSALRKLERLRLLGNGHSDLFVTNIVDDDKFGISTFKQLVYLPSQLSDFNGHLNNTFYAPIFMDTIIDHGRYIGWDYSRFLKERFTIFLAEQAISFRFPILTARTILVESQSTSFNNKGFERKASIYVLDGQDNVADLKSPAATFKGNFVIIDLNTKRPMKVPTSLVESFDH